MTNPKRARSHLTVIDLVVVSTEEGLKLAVRERGAATVPIAKNKPDLPASKKD